MVMGVTKYGYSKYGGEFHCIKTGKALPRGTKISWLGGDCHGECEPNNFEVLCPIHKVYEEVRNKSFVM